MTLRVTRGSAAILHTLTPGFLITILVCLGLGTGCGGGSGAAPESTDGPSATVPVPSACRLVADSPNDLVRDGAEYLVLPDFPARLVEDDGTAAVFSPAWTAGNPLSTGLAFACYSFNLVDFDESNRVDLTFSQTGEATDCWVALSDWAADSWEWHQPVEWSLATDFAPSISTDGNRMLVLVLCTGDDTWRLDEVRIGGSVAVDGYVYGTDGVTPAQSVQISLEGGPYEVFRYGFTDENGYWRIEDVADGDYTVTPYMYGWGFTPAERSVTVAGEPVTVAPFTGGELATVDIGGYVFLPDGETPVGDCSVQITGGSGWRNLATNSAGYYVLEDVFAGEYEVCPVDLRYTYEPEARTIDAQADTTVDPFFATPVTLYNVDGYVLMRDGTTPVAGVEVVVFSYVPAGTTFTATTDAAGYWSLSGIAPYSYFVSPYKDGYDFEPVSTMIVVEDRDVTVETFYGTCPAHYLMDGYVYEDDGVTPVAGVPVHADCTMYSFEAVTDADGYWVMPEVFEQVYTVRPWLAPWVFAPENREVMVLGGDTRVDPFLGTELPNSPVDGYIYETGSTTPVPYVWVTFEYDDLDYHAQSDEAGHYQLDLPYGSWVATPVAGCWDFDPLNRVFTVAGSPVTLDPFYAMPGG